MNFILTSRESDYLFKDNLYHIKERIKKGDSDFCLILPNRKIIKEIRHELSLANGGLSLDLKIWTLDDLVNARDISDYFKDLVVNLSVENLIYRAEFEDNQFFKSESFVDTAKSYIASFKYSRKKAEDISAIKTDNEPVNILAKLYLEYQTLMDKNKIMDKFDYYNKKNLELRNIKDVYIHGFSELRHIEYELLKELSKKDVNIYICVDNYSPYKENFISYFEKLDFKRVDFKDLKEKKQEIKSVRCSSFDVEISRLIYEIHKDLKDKFYGDMAILIDDENKKNSLVEGLKEYGIALREDDKITTSGYKIFKDLVNMLDCDLDYKDYILRMISSDILDNDYEDKKALRFILKDLDFNNLDFVKDFILLRSDENSIKESYLDILTRADNIYKKVSKNDFEIVNFIIDILNSKEYDASFLLIRDDFVELLDTLYKNYRDLLLEFSKLNKYLINLIKNFEVDDSSNYVDGIKIFNLANIKLNSYKNLYVLDASDDSYPKKMKEDFFTNDKTIDILKKNGLDILSKKEIKIREMDRLNDACKLADKIYFSYNTSSSSSVRSRYIKRFDIEDESYSLKDYLQGINKGIEKKDIINIFEEIDLNDEKLNLKNIISPTRIENYFACPMKYFFKYLLGIKKETSSPKLELGNILHKSLQDFYILNKDMIDFAIKDKGDIDLSALDKILENNFIEYGLNLDINENNYNYSLYKDKLRTFIKKDIKRLRQDFKGYYPHLFEETISYDFYGYKINGRIDRIDLNPESGKRVLIDYKTSKSGFVRNQNFKLDSKTDKSYTGYQLALYYFYGKVDKCLYMSINDGEIYDFTQGLSLVDMEEILLKDIEEYMERISQGDFFKKARDKITCSYCDYKDICLVRDKND